MELHGLSRVFQGFRLCLLICGEIFEVRGRYWAGVCSLPPEVRTLGWAREQQPGSLHPVLRPRT
jgi:hypothetical protein